MLFGFELKTKYYNIDLNGEYHRKKPYTREV
jgi:hypothetical protein